MKWPPMPDLTVATRGVATKSAMNPALWLCALATPASLVGATITSSPISYILLAIALMPVINAIIAFNHFMRTDPDRLQSERYLIEKQVVSRMGLNDGEGGEFILMPGPKVENPLLENGDSK